MKKNINRESISEYSQQYAKKLCSIHFSEHKFITGNEILQLSEIKQVNYFIIKTIFGIWKEEVKKLESPYFNYSSIETKKALKEFMNVLSRNIKIKKRNFISLVTQATEDSLVLLLQPREYYTNLFLNCNPLVSEKKLLELRKYIKLDNYLIDRLLKEIKETENKILPTYEIKKIIYSELSETHDSELVDSTIEKLSKIESVELDFFYDDLNKEPLVDDTEEIKTNSEGLNKKGIENKVEEEKEVEIEELEKNSLKEEIPCNQEIEELENKIIEETEDQEAKKPTFQQTELPFDEVPVPQETKPSIHENLQQSTSEVGELSIVDLHQNKKLEQLSSTLSLNQRFRFSNELFDGDRELFTAILKSLDEKSTYEDAISFVNEKCKLEKDTPEETKETFQDFLGLIKKRFD